MRSANRSIHIKNIKTGAVRKVGLEVAQSHVDSGKYRFASNSEYRAFKAPKAVEVVTEVSEEKPVAVKKPKQKKRGRSKK